jgi:glycosyltransferase involved in cell wall biosynthesis
MVELKLLAATVEALAASPEFKQLSITIAGGWSRYEELLAPLRRFENVKVLDQDPAFEGKADLFAKHGVFLAPYGADPHGTALAEAMACALVPVVTDVGAVREVADERSARIVAPSADELARAVLELAASPQSFSEMAENARLRSLTVRGAQWYNDELDRAHYGPS